MKRTQLRRVKGQITKVCIDQKGRGPGWIQIVVSPTERAGFRSVPLRAMLEIGSVSRSLLETESHGFTKAPKS